VDTVVPQGEASRPNVKASVDLGDATLAAGRALAASNERARLTDKASAKVLIVSQLLLFSPRLL